MLRCATRGLRRLELWGTVPLESTCFAHPSLSGEFENLFRGGGELTGNAGLEGLSLGRQFQVVAIPRSRPRFHLRTFELDNSKLSPAFLRPLIKSCTTTLTSLTLPPLHPDSIHFLEALKPPFAAFAPTLRHLTLPGGYSRLFQHLRHFSLSSLALVDFFSRKEAVPLLKATNSSLESIELRYTFRLPEIPIQERCDLQTVLSLLFKEIEFGRLPRLGRLELDPRIRISSFSEECERRKRLFVARGVNLVGGNEETSLLDAFASFLVRARGDVR